MSNPSSSLSRAPSDLSGFWLLAEPNPAPLKAALAGLGEMKNELRAPMTQASDAMRERLLRALSRP